MDLGTYLDPIAALIAVSTVVSALAYASGAAWPQLRDAGPWLMVLACMAIAGFGTILLLTDASWSLRAGNVLDFPVLDVSYDRLSAPFLLVLGVIGAAASVYASGYHLRSGSSVAYPVFLGSMALVFGANGPFAFLIAWEVMALSSAALVIGSRPAPDVLRAGYVYLVLTHLATVALIVAFAILADGDAGTDFGAMARAAQALDPAVRDWTFILLLVGFATKAGAIPVHIWLPRAHPVAPSHVSALMSGVMIKTGIYGLLRLGLEVLGPGPEWWGLLVLGIGVASALLGVLYAVMEHDLKRLLAYSSIENIGIILMAVGVAMMAISADAEPLASLALTAALFHVVSHALIKSALFLGAGSVQAAVGARGLDALGGLARAMPITAIGFGIAAAAIAGLPPLNGFAGEWLTAQALFGAGNDATLSSLGRAASLVAVGGLALTAALAVAAFVKAVGIAFLGVPRTDAAAAAREVRRRMRGPTLLLAALCVAVGLGAGWIAAPLRIAASDLLQVGPTSHDIPLPLALAGASDGAYISTGIGLLIAGISVVAWWLTARRGRVRRALTWTGGIAPEAAFQTNATSYAKLIRLYFRPVLRPEREIEVERHPGSPLARTVRYRGMVRPLLDEPSYQPMHAFAVTAANVVRRLQSGSLQLYLAYTVVALVILLLLAR